MEPMSLGSPISSPMQNSTNPGDSSPYLPSFLLGDTNTPVKFSVMNSHQDNPRHLNITNTSLMSPISYKTPDYRSNRQKAVFGSTTPSTPQNNTKNHTGGPPTRGLFDNLEVSQVSSPYTSVNPVAANPMCTSVQNQSRLMSSTIASPISFPDSSMNLTTNDSQSILQWVTVFGFLPTDINTVLSYISSRVRIVDKHLAPRSQSNWIHLKCMSEQEVQKALMCNGSVVTGSIMIGVIPCTDEGVLGSDKENRAKLNERPFTTINKTNQSTTLAVTPFHMSPSSRRRKLRSLTAGYNQHLSPQCAQSIENIPQKSTGLVSKAMEYMFGW